MCIRDRFTAVALSAQGDTLAGRPLSWASSDSLVARVSQTGRMIARSAGTAQISVSADEATTAIDVVVNEGGIVAWQLTGSGSWSDPASWGGALRATLVDSPSFVFVFSFVSIYTQ